MQDGGVHAVQEEPLPIAEEPIPWEEVQLYAERPESVTRLASDLPSPLKEELIQCLIHNRDVFAWSTEELPGAKPKIAEHKLHLLSNSRPVKQKKRNFSVDQNKIIRAEVDQLRKASHVREVQFPSWLSNVVLVKKPNNKWRKIQAWCKGFGITQAFTSVAYPQSNGQTEVVNREIVRGLKVKLDHVGGIWVEELSSILWAYRTTPRESTGLTPFHLVYDNEAVVPIEIGVPSVRRTLYDEENTQRRLSELNLISETRDRTTAQLEAYRQRMRQNYNRRVIP
ncbi:uncharacterized protein LOC122035286 [Zingiber officinale]|uniref:uncharacterized protein LOC122035286 n=1 Tax=Zingiber officinale TaxID=94328 RepID=UPI001C4AE53A|nr:uncharacterized protein LOC122035286 [Zingiber officinale]